MNYRKIPQSVADKLRPIEAYVYLALASKSDMKLMKVRLMKILWLN
jgi:hypothetical protein